MLKTINPATEEVIDHYELMEDSRMEAIVDESNTAQPFWNKQTFRDRSERLQRIAEILKGRKNELAELMAREMGKPLAQGISEAEKCAWVCEYYADHAEEFLQDNTISTDANRSYIHYEPLGTVLAIMPWNFPFWQLFRFAAPALMAGNAAILKHAPNVTGCALEIEKIIHEAGVPEKVFRTIIADIDQTQKLIRHPGIGAVTLTGSTRAGKAVAEQAGSVIKKSVLELGGSDPYLILEDADVEKAAEICVTSRLINSGQSCIAAKRFIAVKSVYDEFLERVVELMKQKTVGDPFKEETDVGPMARKDLRDTLHGQVRKSIDQGAECLLGGKLPEVQGTFYPVTVLTNIGKGMPAYQEELFGPVASVFKVRDEEEAITVANDTNYGLGAAVFSEDEKRAEHIARTKLQAGCCFVNDFVKSDPRLPFGGIKESGFGRELSHLGIREFVNAKTVYIK